MKLKKNQIEQDLLLFLDLIEYKKNSIDGIYYSTKTGRIFETIKDNHGHVITRYCDNEQPEFGPVITEDMFCFQFHIGIYEEVINYRHEGIE